MNVRQKTSERHRRAESRLHAPALRATAYATLIGTLVLAVGCTTPSPTPEPTIPPPMPTPVPRPTITATATVTSTASGLMPTEAVSISSEVVAFPSGSDVRPGDWSPVGDALLAYEIVRSGGSSGPIGHLWTVDAAAAEPLWDSGDMEGLLSGAPMASWQADGTLVLARRDGMFVRADGSRVGEVTGLDGQPRSVSVGPDGGTIFVDGPEANWIVGADRVARQVSGRTPDGFDSWSWHAGGYRIALSAPGGEYFALEVITNTLHKFAELPSAGNPERLPPPRWLGDQRVFVSQATDVTQDGARAMTHRVVDPDTTMSQTVAEMIGIAPNPWMPDDGSEWVSADGRFLVYPEYAREEGATEPAHVASWLLDTLAGEATRLEPLAHPIWAPTGDRFAYRRERALAVWFVTSDTSLTLVSDEPGIENHAWSPDARWLLYQTTDGALWIVAGDGRAGPARIADEVRWEPAPTWAPDGNRFAAAIGRGGEAPALALVTVE